MSSDPIGKNSHDGPDLPLNDYIQTETANDPVVEISKSARITVNGGTVTVEEGDTSRRRQANRR